MHTHSVYLIDIQDTYLLAFEKKGAEQQWQAFIDILQAVDSSVLVEYTGKHITSSVKNRICDVIKDVVEQRDTKTTTLQQVAEDIDVLTKVITLEERYNFLMTSASNSSEALPEHKTAEIAKSAYEPSQRERTLFPFSSTQTKDQDSESSSVQAADYTIPQYAGYNDAARAVNVQNFTIIWSRLNNMSLVFEECGRHACSADEACAACLNFDVVQKVAFTDGHVEHFKAMFHQKIWDNLQQLQEKVKCFQQLYEKDAVACESHTTSERQRVLTLLRDGFELSQDPAKRMKASELTAMLSAKLAMTGTEQAAGFKQRLPAYLLEAGLQKKRLSEGIFYYGIEASVSTRFEQNRAHTVKELEEQRDAQIKDVKASGYKTEDSLAGLGSYLKQPENSAPNALEEVFAHLILPHEIPCEIPQKGEHFEKSMTGKARKPVQAQNVVYSTFVLG